MQMLVIDGELPDLNYYIRIERGNKFGAAKIKEAATVLVARYLQYKRIKPIKGKVFIEFKWYCKNKKKDPDNIVFAKKFLLDGLKEAGIIENDGWNNIDGWRESWLVDEKKPRIELYLWEGKTDE